MSKSDILQPRGPLCVVVAHPDDAELGSFGTIARFAESGESCHVIVASSGERGVRVIDSAAPTPTAESVQLGSRRQEMEEAFDGLSVSIIFLNFKDGFITADQALISEMELIFRRIAPSTVISHCGRCLTDHQDHSSVGRAALNAASRTSSIISFWEMEPLVASKDPWQPNLFVDVTKLFDQKLAALSKHQTQSGREYLTRSWQEHRARQNAILAGVKLEDGRLFEAFNVVRHVY